MAGRDLEPARLDRASTPALFRRGGESYPEGMLYHARVSTDEARRRLDHTDEAYAFHLSQDELRRRFVDPWTACQEIVCGGLTFAPEHTRVEILQTSNASSQPFAGRASWNHAESSTDTHDVTDDFITHRDPRVDLSGTGGQPTRNPRAVMVVYGQDQAANEAIFEWLRAIGLEPREWSELTRATGKASPFIGQVLDTAFQDAQAVVVLFTPDEHVRSRADLVSSREAWRLQARPNVLFEAGMTFATHADRRVLVVLGNQDLPSDLAGRHYVRIAGPESLHELANRLETAGCEVRRGGTQWLNMSRFPVRDGLVFGPPDPPAQAETSAAVFARHIERELNANVEVAATDLLDRDLPLTGDEVARWTGSTEVTIRTRCGRSYAARFRAAGRGLAPADELRTKVAFIHDDLAAQTQAGSFSSGPRAGAWGAPARSSRWIDPLAVVEGAAHPSQPSSARSPAR